MDGESRGEVFKEDPLMFEERNKEKEQDHMIHMFVSLFFRSEILCREPPRTQEAAGTKLRGSYIDPIGF